jgi:hypothetical protein
MKLHIYELEGVKNGWPIEEGSWPKDSFVQQTQNIM